MKKHPPFSLYIHIPWCIQKCPYCDFNSHALESSKHPKRKSFDEDCYVDALLADFKQHVVPLKNRPLSSIFIGGGTPSLFSSAAIAHLLMQIQQIHPFSPDIEITMEANPGTAEQHRFDGYYQAGVNRLSIGVQSFNNHQLKALGRIHQSQEAINAVQMAKQAGFQQINLDLMFGLPNQTQEEALKDLTTAIELEPTHLSWYQLTIEPNTAFFRRPPKNRPDHDALFHIHQTGIDLLKDHAFAQYEISAFSKTGDSSTDNQCQHNLCYWNFGDYLGIGAGAHSKITDQNALITRSWRYRAPSQYTDSTKEFVAGTKRVEQSELALEYLMNRLRLLHQPISFQELNEQTALTSQQIDNFILKASQQNLITANNKQFHLTTKGKSFVDEVLLLV